MSASAPRFSNTLVDGIRSKPVVAIWLLFALYALASYGWRMEWMFETYLRHGVPIDIDGDFVNYWIAGKLTLSGQHLQAFNDPQFNAQIDTLFGATRQDRSWSYPPHFLLLLWPLGFLDYGKALAAFLAITFSLFVGGVLSLRRRVEQQANLSLTALALVGFVLTMLSAMQNGFLMSAAALCVLAFMQQRPVIAGFALAILTMKPQLGFLFPLLAVMDRNWPLLRWATFFTALLVGMSTALFGVEAWHDYLTRVLPNQQFVMTDWYGAFIKMMPSTFGSFRALHFSAETAFYAQAAVSIFGLAYLVGLLRRLSDPIQRAFALLAGTFVVTPYSFNYDMGALSVVAALLAQREYSRENRAPTAIIAIVAVLPGVITALGRAHLPIAPVALIAGLIAIGLLASRSNRPAAAARPGYFSNVNTP